MKVAVLLRGQARFSELAARFFMETVVNKNPDIEFRFWGHTWRTMNVSLTTPDFKNDVNRYHSKIFSTAEIMERVSPWNLSGVTVSSDRILYDLSKDIVNKNHRNGKHGYKWVQHNLNFDEVQDKYSLPSGTFILFPGFAHMHYDELITTTNNICGDIKWFHYLFIDHAYKLGNLLGQMYSAGLSYDCYKNREDQDWVPDIIWSARWDGVFECNNLATVLHNVIVDTGSQAIIFTKHLKVTHSRVWLDDYNFLMTPFSAEQSLSNMHDRLFQIYTGSRYVLADLLDSGLLLQHLMWSKLATHDVTFEQMARPSWDHFLIRPNSANIPPDEMTVDRLRAATNNFVYPQGSGDLDIYELERIMNLPDDV